MRGRACILTAVCPDLPLVCLVCRIRLPGGILFDSRDVAASVAQECLEHKFSSTNTKIRKLLNCVCGVLPAWKDERVCDEPPHAWPYGPVFPRVFWLMHNGEDMTEYSTAVRDTGSEAIKATVQSVLEIFGPLRAGQLAALLSCPMMALRRWRRP